MMAGLGTFLRKELLEQWRTLRLPVVAMIFLLVGLSSPLLARFTPDILEAVAGDQFQVVLPTPTAADAVDQLAKNLGQFGGLIAVLLAMVVGAGVRLAAFERVRPTLEDVFLELVGTPTADELDGRGFVRAREVER
jgi:hypothetical protein